MNVISLLTYCVIDSLTITLISCLIKLISSIPIYGVIQIFPDLNIYENYAARNRISILC